MDSRRPPDTIQLSAVLFAAFLCVSAVNRFISTYLIATRVYHPLSWVTLIQSSGAEQKRLNPELTTIIPQTRSSNPGTHSTRTAPSRPAPRSHSVVALRTP